MRFLLDENLSEALLDDLADLVPDSLHVRLLGAGGAHDEVVWELARYHDCILVTRDEDFLRLGVLRGPPPKVVWIAVGNCTNPELVRLLRRRMDELRAFASQNESAFLVLTR